MIGHQLALIKRELWEHRAIYIVPLVIAFVVSLLATTGHVSISAYGQQVDLAIVGASNLGDAERAAIMTGYLSILTTIFAFGAWILMVFYSLDALYAERKDKSILFWRSLPVTDSESVISKLITAAVAVPLITFVIVIAAHLLNLVILSIWVSIEGGNAGHLVWGSAPLFATWTAILIIFLCLSLWFSPFIGWFLFVSAYAKRLPMLLAFLPIIVLPMIEELLSRHTSYFWEAFFVRTFTPPLFRDAEIREIVLSDEVTFNAEMVDLLAAIDLGRFLASPSLWAGVVVCGLLTTAAIYVRRFRDDS